MFWSMRETNEEVCQVTYFNDSNIADLRGTLNMIINNQLTESGGPREGGCQAEQVLLTYSLLHITCYYSNKYSTSRRILICALSMFSFK